MTSKKICRYTNVELLDLIKNGQSNSMVETAEAELEKRKLTEKELKNAESEYLKFREYKEKRKTEPLTRDEWLSFFILPFFTPRPKWRKNDNHSESEYQRFHKYGFEEKARQAAEVQKWGYIFWIVMFILGMVVYSYIT